MKEEIEILAQFNKGHTKVIKLTVSGNVYNVTSTAQERSQEGTQEYSIQGSNFNGRILYEFSSNKWYATEFNIF